MSSENGARPADRVSGDAVDPALVRNLLSLRLLLQQGVRTAQSSPGLRRTTAVVLLDAAVERAVHMVATDSGLARKKDDLESLLSSVVQHLDRSWKPVGLASIRQLHRARNAVQHEGLGADESELDGWVAAATRFVADLIRAKYELDLGRLSLASALADSGMRSAFCMAEVARDNGQIDGCFGWLLSLFGEVRSRWERYIDEGVARTVFKPHRVIDAGAMAYLEGQIATLRSLALISPLTLDLAEVAWFLKASRESQYLDEVDAERALNVVFWLIVAFEGSPAADPRADRRLAWMKSRRQVRAGDGPARMSGYALRQGAVGPPAVVIRLSDVPASDSEFTVWLAILRQILALKTGAGNGRSQVHVDESGLVTFSQSPTHEISVDAFVQALGPALEEAERLFHLQVGVMAAEESNVREWAEGVRAELATISFPEWVSNVDVDQTQPGVAVVRLGLSAAGMGNDLVGSIRQHPEITEARYSVSEDSTELRIRPAVPELLASVLDGATPIVVRRIDEQRRSIEGSTGQREEISRLMAKYHVPEDAALA